VAASPHQRRIKTARPGARTAALVLAFLSTDCRHVMINEHMTEICGISAGDHIGRSVHEMVIVQTIQCTGEPIVGIELNGQRSDGSNGNRVWITYWHLLKDRRGNIVGINVAAEEITERKRAEVELAASRERLVNLNRILAERVAEGSMPEADARILLTERGSVLIARCAPAKACGWECKSLTATAIIVRGTDSFRRTHANG
jgi:hypothetical protein